MMETIGVRKTLATHDPPLHSVAELEAAHHFTRPYSLRELLLAADVVVHKHQIVTPSGTGLGGWIELRVAGNGAYLFKGHLHGSGFDSYEFRIHVAVRGGLVAVGFRKTGSVGGTTGGGSRNCDWEETGISSNLRKYWPDLRAGQLTVAFDYQDTGFIGVVEHLAKDLLSFMIAKVLVGGPVAAFIVLGSELGELSGVSFAAPGLPAGILVAGGTVFLFGPGMIIPAVIAGALVATQFKSRSLHEEEKQLARKVFADTLPFDRIRLTNLKKPPKNRAFVVPNVDGSILVNLGDAYDEPIKDATNESGNWRPQTFIHELVHTWQIEYRPLPLDVAWQSAVAEMDRESAYHFSLPIEDWGSMHIEAQASAVAFWYRMFHDDLEGIGATSHPLFDYVARHIRLKTG